MTANMIVSPLIYARPTRDHSSCAPDAASSSSIDMQAMTDRRRKRRSTPQYQGAVGLRHPEIINEVGPTDDKTAALTQDNETVDRAHATAFG